MGFLSKRKRSLPYSINIVHVPLQKNLGVLLTLSMSETIKKICQSSFLNLYIYLKLVEKVSEAFEISICKSYLFHSLTFVNFDTESYIIIYILYKYILYIILFKLFKLFKIILTNLRLPLDSLQVAKAS